MRFGFGRLRSVVAGFVLLAAALAGPFAMPAAAVTLMNVSYDPTREFYVAYDALFAAYWKKQAGEDVTIQQSHGGSGKQARAVIDGLDADVVTLGIPTDIDAIAAQGLLAEGWADIAKPGIGVITANPKTSSGGQMAYYAAWGWAMDQFGGDEGKIRAYM